MFTTGNNRRYYNPESTRYMIKTIRRIIKSAEVKNDKETSSQHHAQPISRLYHQNLHCIKTYFENANDIIIREFEIGFKARIKAFIVMVDGLVNMEVINESLLKSIMLHAQVSEPSHHVNKDNVFDAVKNRALSIAAVSEAKTIEEAIDSILSGDVPIFIDGADSAIITAIRGWESRGVIEPVTETVVRGPREGFVETLRVNTSLIRRKIKNTNLKFETFIIGKQTKTQVCIAYLKNIVKDSLVSEVKSRLKKIDTDSILESGYIECYIGDEPYSIFPTIGNTEKPDVVCAKILEGRVAILVDGTPFVLTVPYLFAESFQISEDYYSRPYYSTFIRLLRWLCFAIAISSPAIYIAFTSYHHEVFPPALLVTISAAKEGTPFPIFVEALFMLIIFEILREAGIRLPKVVGQAVSIVGALVIGEAAVSAGLIGAPMVIVVSLTAIATFVITPLTDVVSLLRLALTLLAGFAGQYGIMLGFAAILTHMCSLSSFGAPYLAPIAPYIKSDMKDTFRRAPWWDMLTRPRILQNKNVNRQTSRIQSQNNTDKGGAARGRAR